MTRAYDDIEAVTRLLEEKEKDLELTVQIGKELLTQNNSLENKIADLEADLKSCNDDRSQLLHELHKKNELIAVLTNDTDDSENGKNINKLSNTASYSLATAVSEPCIKHKLCRRVVTIRVNFKIFIKCT